MSTRASAVQVVSPGPEPAPARVLQRCGGRDCACGCRSGRDPADGAFAPASVGAVVGSAGVPLDPALRHDLEPRFGFDFSGVRIHADAPAAGSASEVAARAYTVGRHVVFGAHEYAPATPAGRRLLEHELTHVVQQNRAGVADVQGGRIAVLDDPELELQASRGAPPAAVPTIPAGVAQLQRDRQDTLRRQTCETAATADRYPAAACTYRAPENCPTYERWIATFTRLRTFEARASPTPSTTGPDVFTIIGGGAAAREPTSATAAGSRPAPRVGGRRLGEQFIDHPTDAWVNECLPENLRATAYQLPSDCADIAVILRHVWLTKHLRTERVGRWTIGSRTGESAQRNIQDVIGSVYTGNVADMVNPYSDSAGRPIRSFAALEPLLHPGDVLVWSHFDNGFDRPRTGGHTLTISGIDRDNAGRITRLRALQGNEPIFDPEKTEIIPRLGLRDTPSIRRELGEAPARRIETNELRRSAGDLAEQSLPGGRGEQPQRVWRWGATTLLVVAGPPRAAARPAMQRGSRVRRLTDWVPAFDNAAGRNDLVGAWEAMLGEARAVIEGGGTLDAAEARRVGTAAGRALWRLARGAAGLGNEEHFRRLRELQAIVATVRASGDRARAGSPRAVLAGRLSSQLAPLAEAFTDAARGGADLSFGVDVPRGSEAVNILVTGFDPFVTAGPGTPPAAGDWNPSGAAALALDGARIPLAARAVAAVEGVVLPVDFAAFGLGMVERIARPHAGEVDAVLSVSVDPGMERASGKRPSPVRLEHFAVGVREPPSGLEPVPAAPGGRVGAPIIESTAPLDEIAAGTEQPATRRTPEIDRPTIGESIRFRFDTPAEAAAALAALQTSRAAPVGKILGGRQLVLGDRAALAQVVSTLQRRSGVSIGFTAAGRSFHAVVVEGPGGNFLSNEVAYRMLRLLAETPSPRSPIAFHTHTEPGNVIPSDPSARGPALALAGEIRDRLVRTLHRMIEVVGRIVLRRRRARGTGTGP